MADTATNPGASEIISPATPRPPKRLVKVLRLRILKPAGAMTWNELGQLLRDARYRVFRLANLIVSEAYLAFHVWRTKQTEQFQPAKPSALNLRLRQMLADEKVPAADLERFAVKGALPDTVASALERYKIGSITAKAKWQDVIRGRSALPTFRNDMSIPIRCHKPEMRRLERVRDRDVELDLMICLSPYPRVVLQTGAIGEGAEAILKRLLDNPKQLMDGYRQRCLEVKQDRIDGKWWLYVTYDMPLPPQPKLSPGVMVGVDLGVSCPLYAAINNGHARLGWRAFQALGARIHSLQRQVMGRRRSMLRGGRLGPSAETARSGHGRKRKLRPIERLEGRIDSAYNTLNHQLSRTVVEFAINNGAGVIQMEDLTTLKEELRGSYIGANWRYFQLQNFIAYKAKEVGIELRKVNPRFTSRRCSKCGHIEVGFNRAFRDANRVDGRVARFKCSQCQFESDPDYNAARNLATLDIDKLIEAQCRTQGIAANALSQVDLRPSTPPASPSGQSRADG